MLNQQAIAQIETFVKVALSEISDLRGQLTTLTEKRAAEAATHDKALTTALTKAAEAMYESDFITDADDKQAFVKRAKEDPIFLASVVSRVCRAADVAYMGKQASVHSSTSSEDPVMQRAFGFSAMTQLLDEASLLA